MKLEDPPFGLGQTLPGKDSAGTLLNSKWLGQIHEFPVADLTVAQIRGSKSRQTGATVKAVCLRNTSGQTLYGKRIAKLEIAGGRPNLESVIGYADTLIEKRCVIIDEYIATGGVADDDIFWGVIAGPVTVKTAFAGAGFNGDIAVDAPLVAATYANSTDPNGGRVSNTKLANNTDAQGAIDNAVNMLGFALSSATTAQTDADLLIQAAIRF